MARSFAEIRKDVTAQSVHVVTALGNEDGKRKARRYRDVSTAYVPADAEKPSARVIVKALQASQSLGLVFGWAIVCKENGHDYYDLNIDKAGPHEGVFVPEHIPEDAMLKAAVGFAEGERAGNEMHEGPESGRYPFVFPLTTDIAKAMGIETNKTGLMVAYKPEPDVLAKFVSGEYRGFSIEGRKLAWEHTK